MITIRSTSVAVILLALTAIAEAADFTGGGTVLRTPAPELPSIAIIIDDLGNTPSQDRRAVELPAHVTCAFLPHTTATPELARAAFASGKEVLIHQPMESIDGKKLGPGGLRAAMSRTEFRDTLTANMAAVPYATGMNNHMGSLLTANREKMTWLMEQISLWNGFFFVDSRTDDRTVAEEVARLAGVPGSRRDLFLDNEPTHEAVRRQFDQLIRLAQHRGSAIAIGHPYPATLDVLEQRLQNLADQGVRVVPVSEVIAARHSPHPLEAGHLRPVEIAQGR